MPHGNPAGLRCVQLDDANMCGTDSTHALLYLARLEPLTAPQ